MDELIVETGLVVAGADAYVDVAYADTYHLNRGNSAWANASADARRVAIRQATVFLDMRYLGRWKGARLTATQPRQFPRYGVTLQDTRSNSTSSFDEGFVGGLIPSNIIPVPIKAATCELALRALSATLAPDLPRGGQIKRKKGAVGETEYFAGASPYTVYQMVELLIGDFIESSCISELVRA